MFPSSAVNPREVSIAIYKLRWGRGEEWLKMFINYCLIYDQEDFN